MYKPPTQLAVFFIALYAPLIVSSVQSIAWSKFWPTVSHLPTYLKKYKHTMLRITIFNNNEQNYHVSIVYKIVDFTHLEGNTDEQRKC